MTTDISISREAVMLLTTDECDEPMQVTFGQFVDDNEFGDEWLAEIVASLGVMGHYIGGGGSAPDWRLDAIDL